MIFIGIKAEMHNCFCCLLALLWLNTALAEPVEFLVSYGSHNGQPYVFIEKNKLASGIIKDIADELAKLLQVEINYRETPRKREFTHLAQNINHAIIISNPEWVHNSEQYQWSEPIFIGKTVLVVNKHNSKVVNKIDDLANMTLGTIRGYHYPILDPLFDKNIVFRSDVKSIELNFSRLNKGWIDGLVDSNLLARYYLKTMPVEQKNVVISTLFINEYPLRSALSPNSPVTLAKYNEALKQMKQNGTINTILKKYVVEYSSEHPINP